MGKGDKKTRRGKIWGGTFGVSRRPSENKKSPLSKKINPSVKQNQS